MHDSFIAHYHPTLISSYPGSPCLDIWWRWLCGGRGGGYYKAGVSALWLAGGIRLICCDYYGVRPCTPPPHSARPRSIHTQQCMLSLFQGEYQLCTGRRGLAQPLSSSAYTFPENHMSTQAAPLLYKTWHSNHRGSTWSTVTAVRGFHRDYFTPFWTIFNDF